MQYILRTDTGVRYPIEELPTLGKDPRCVVVDEDEVVAPEEVAPTTDRMQQIVEAVKQIDPENYGAPAGGRPAMPRVAAVVALTGFQVKADEIVQALQIIKG